MKKKSEALLTFMGFVTFLDGKHDMKVCILHTDFGEVNSDTAKPYLQGKRSSGKHLPPMLNNKMA